MEKEINQREDNNSKGIRYLFALLLVIVVASGIAVYLSRSAQVASLSGQSGDKDRAFEGGTFEASGVVSVPGAGGILFVDDGKAGEVQWMQLDANGNQMGAIRPVRLGVDIQDLEGITTDGRYFYVVSSQAKKGSDRHGIVRFTFDPESRSAGGVETLSDLKRYLVENVGQLKDMADRKAKDDGLNIEGLAWDPRGERLLLGLRSPVVDGQAVVVAMKLRDPRGPFSYENISAAETEVIRLPLGGLGIRSIEFDDRSKAFRIIAGATESQDRADFKLWEWNGDAGRPALKEAARFGGKLKPEGITRASAGGNEFIFVVFDNSRYMRME
ncbi:MAG TPA: DUF3616 domain-containing protein [Blastocatellia bacterium]|nr:DUF3616 domain-containing protein [Blastocatellia bacterium]